VTVASPDVISPQPWTPRLSGRWARLLRGRTDDPAWARPSLVLLLAATAALYLWDLRASGWANSFYSAAVQAGSHNAKAMFFGSFDSSNFVTVDKPPASLWVMDVSARIFGLNAWSILVPQALEGVAAVGLLHAAVRRHFGAAEALVAAGVLATTPVAVLMFRFNNPDALLTLLLVGAAYSVARAIEAAGTRWLVLAGALVGLGFITKMLQAVVIVPGFAVVYLVCAPASLRRRIGQLLGAGVALVVAAGWWVAAVALTPASARPYVGGSTDNSVLQLAFGYNGFGRLTGNETGSVGGGGGAGGGMWGSTGITRLFGTDMGTQISWLLPAALGLGAVMLWLTRRVTRTDPGRAQVLLWATWLVVTGLVFSFGQGIIHPYYTVALAPAIGALVGIGAVQLWRRRESLVARTVLAVVLAGTAVWADRLLDRSPTWHPWLRAAVLAAGLVVAVGLLVPPRLRGWPMARASGVLAAAMLVVGVAGPTAFALDTATTPHTGAIPSAGPASRGGRGPGGFGFGAAGGGGRGGLGQRNRRLLGGNGGPGAGRPGGQGSPFGGLPFGTLPFRGGGPAGPGRPAGGGAAGGLLEARTPSSALTAALRAKASSYTWAAATVGAENAAGYQLAAREPVMAVGGFNGTDPTPSLARFESLVAAGTIHYFIGGRGFGRGMGGSGDAGRISTWVADTFTPTTIGGTTVYDLSTPTGSGSTAT
jgi:4-amino-4-deoxy-L-arabinose transferase-like glycosyltransferase